MSQTPPKWKKTDESIILENYPNHIEIGLYYLRIYTAGAGYTYSNDNDLIHNLKKPPNSTAQVLAYKKWAVSQFAADLNRLLQKQPENSTLYLVPTPSSKCKMDSEYDDRLVQVVSQVCNGASNLIAFPILLRTHSIDAQHIASGQRSVERAGEHLEIDNSVAAIYKPGATIAIVDDVLLSGSTFSACRDRILSKFPKSKIVGIFWALSKNRDPTELLDELK